MLHQARGARASDALTEGAERGASPSPSRPHAILLRASEPATPTRAARGAPPRGRGARAGRLARRGAGRRRRRADLEPGRLAEALRRGQAQPLGPPDAAGHRVLAADDEGAQGRQAAPAHRGRLPRGLPAAVDAGTSTDGNEWVRVRLPARPNGRKGWVAPRGAGRLQPREHAHRRRRSEAARDALPGGKQGLLGARRDRHAVDAHAHRAVLDPREVPRGPAARSTARMRSARAPTHRRCRTGPAAAWSACTGPTSRSSSPVARRTAASGCATRTSRASTGSRRAVRRSASCRRVARGILAAWTTCTTSRTGRSSSSRSTGRSG